MFRNIIDKTQAKDATTDNFLYLCDMNNPKYIVAFTGHRSYDGGADAALKSCIAGLYAEGARTFRVGMAEGFDLAAAEAVICLKQQHSDIILEAYIPYTSFDSHLNSRDLDRYRKILASTECTYILSDRYCHGIYQLRNNRLVDGADIVVAWWDGTSSGTGYTVKRAVKQQLRIINLCPTPAIAELPL